MANAMGGAEEEVFETPDLAEDDMLEAGRSERSQETASLRAGNHKARPDGIIVVDGEDTCKACSATACVCVCVFG